jgi:hypothetical protein
MRSTPPEEKEQRQSILFAILSAILREAGPIAVDAELLSHRLAGRIAALRCGGSGVKAGIRDVGLPQVVDCGVLGTEPSVSRLFH